MPPAPTKPSTLDSRTLMSQRYTVVPISTGITWGRIPIA